MNFVMNQRQSNTGMIALAEVITSKSGDPRVQAFAKQVADECTKMSASLTSIASPKNVTLPDEIPAAELSFRSKLRRLTGSRLDRSYLKIMRKDTARRVKSFRVEARKGREPAVQKFAGETLPVLENHLEKARALYLATEKKT